MNFKEENERALKIMAENLKKLREESGWSIRILAEKTGLSVQALEAAERGGDFGTEDLQTLCRLYNRKLSEFFQPL